MTQFNTTHDPIALSLFASRMTAVSEEMGAVLRHAAFSPNIRDRLDYSCAVFDARGRLCAQAAHIPVHLGSMAYAMTGLVEAMAWMPGDMLVVNDPYLGGTHLPDVTLVAPLFIDDQLAGFVANRAHHADIGAQSPGSMPISSCLEEEGVVIPPTFWMRQGQLQHGDIAYILNRLGDPVQAQGDFSAQVSANIKGIERLKVLVDSLGQAEFHSRLSQLNQYASRLAQSVMRDIPDGHYRFSDVMDDDGQGNKNISITCCIGVTGQRVAVDFAGTSDQVAGNINCPLAVTAAAVYYAFRCLMPAHMPDCEGAFRFLTITTPAGSLVNARRPAAVAAGNVETSTRIVDVVLGALAQALPMQIPAASHGSMNNVAMGAHESGNHWDYYETIGGGMGGGYLNAGQNCVQTHMTNTLNTPVEVLETHYPLQVVRYERRRNSGGCGQHAGGDGVIREYRFLKPAQVTLLTERRQVSPWGLEGGLNAKIGENYINNQRVGPKESLSVDTGDRLRIETPGGGGWGVTNN